MHILHLIKTSEGAAWALNLLEDLKQKYADLTFSVALPLGGRYSERYNKICRNVYYFEYGINFNLLKSGRGLRKIVYKDSPDIIHSWFAQTTLYERLFLRNCNIPILFQVVGPLHLENKIFRCGDVWSATKKNYWIATSKYIRDIYLNSGISKEKVFLNYAYIDIDKLVRDKDNIEVIDVRRRYNIPESYKIIGTASYIYPPKFYEKVGVKGHEYLLDAFAKVLKKRSDVVLIVAGDIFGNASAYRTKLIQKAKTIDPKRIFFTGKYNHVYEIIANFDLFVYLSKSENLGGVFESLLFEVPTISSNRGALPELVIPGETGYLVDITNVKEISKTILSALQNTNSEYLKNGKQKVIETFDKNRILESSYHIYNSILE